MKQLDNLKWRLVLLFSILFSVLNAQVQQHRWYLADQEIDFTTPIPTATTINPTFGAGGPNTDFMGSGNGIHDANGNKILSVYNYTIYSNTGVLGSLDHFEFAVGSPQIIPKPGSECGYYIIYNSTQPYIDNPDDSIIHYCDGATGYFNTFFTEVDMSANFGAGAIISNGNAIKHCENFFRPTPLAVTTELVSGNRYMYLLSGALSVSTVEIKKYLISSTGITFVNNIYSGTMLNGVEAVELELSHDGSMLALADNDGDKAYIFHLNPATGNLVPGAGNNADGTSDYTIPSSTDQLTGVEFSYLGNYLYIGSRNDGIHRIDILANTVSATPLFGSEDYGNSILELGYDPSGQHKIYAVSTTGFTGIENLGAITDPSGSPSFIQNYVVGVSVYDNGYAADNAFSNKMRQLPEQIDGEDYVARFATSTGTCCATLEGFDTYNYTATVNDTWEPGDNPFSNLSVVRVAEEIRIPTGKIITMKNMIFKFNEGAKLVIEPGARLILTNTTLTSMDCDGLMWLGVELQGNATIDQTPFSQQGHLIMQSNSEISNAHNGISVYGRDAFDNVDWSKTGGLVQASNSVFRNNIRDVEYLYYNFKNLGYFRNCQFLTDAAINNGATPSVHVSMYHVDGIAFYGCDFRNTTTGLYADQLRGMGIKSIDAKYKVTYSCTAILPFGTPCPDADKDGNLFENLFFGIEATASNPLYTVDIRYNDFINNTRGVYLGGVDFAYFVNNNIEVATPISYSYGLYLDNCSGYAVENNDFSTIYGAATYGAIVVNSNNGGTTSDVNEIYHNNFDGFDYGATAGFTNVQMVGPNPVTNTGLTFKCNNFDNSITVDILTIFGGISPFQGSCAPSALGDPHAQANNQFSTVPSAVGDFWNANSIVFQMDYRYEDGSPMYQTEPRVGYYNTVNTTTSMCGVFDPLLSCPEARYDLVNGKLISKISLYKQTANDLSDQIDGGDTQVLLSEVNSGSAPGQLKNLMLQYSPYLSDEVLIALIERTPSLPHGILKEIILANSPVSPAVLEKLNEISLPNGVRNQIVAAQVGISPMKDLQSEISYWYRESELNFNELSRRYIHDTTIVNGEDSLKILFANSDKIINNKCRLSELHIKEGDYATAQNIIDDLKLAEDGKHSEFCEYLELLIELEMAIKKCYSLHDDTSKTETLEITAESENGSRECFGATMLLKAVFEYPYQEWIPFFSNPKSMQTNITNNVEVDNQIYIYPNPAQDFVTIELNLNSEETAIVFVYDLTGKIIQSENITNNKSYMSTSNLTNGTYIITIVMPDGHKLIRKLTVSK
jgi:hypothetical protein